MANIRSFKELRVWQNAIDVAMIIFELTKSFPVEERFSCFRPNTSFFAFCSCKYFRSLEYSAAFVSKLSDAESEAAETQTWVEIALRCCYVSQEEALELDRRCEEILSQLVTMASQPEKWTIKDR
jgi:four helix bundle protein